LDFSASPEAHEKNLDIVALFLAQSLYRDGKVTFGTRVQFMCPAAGLFQNNPRDLRMYVPTWLLKIAANSVVVLYSVKSLSKCERSASGSKTLHALNAGHSSLKSLEQSSSIEISTPKPRRNLESRTATINVVRASSTRVGSHIVLR